MALAVSIITFAPVLDHASRIVMETDSLTSALVISTDAARSPLLVAAHTLLVASPQYIQLLAERAVGRQIEVGHIYGPANVAADFLSRGNTAAFNAFCANLHVKPHLSRYLSLIHI